MSNDNPKPSSDQRDALAEAEKKSSEQQPRSYDERNVDDKVVHINPPESDEAIKGLDPAQPRK
jgi:hypothetical protein